MCVRTRFQTDQILSHHGDGAYRSLMVLRSHDATQQLLINNNGSRSQAGSDDCILN